MTISLDLPESEPTTLTYLGIDPGATGGIVMLRSDHRKPTIYEMPKTEQDIYRVIKYLATWSPVAIIEKISHAIFHIDKGDGAKLFGSYMALRMALTACEIPFEADDATTWHKGLGIQPRRKDEDTTRWKNRLRAHSQQLYPKEVIHKTVADAVLIAVYCQRKHTGLLNAASTTTNV